MPRISYDEPTAAAFKAVREIPRDGLTEWRDAVRSHLRPSQGMILVDIGAGTGAFAAAFSDWFDLSVLAVEPSAAMRDQIPRTPAHPGGSRTSTSRGDPTPSKASRRALSGPPGFRAHPERPLRRGFLLREPQSHLTNPRMSRDLRP